MSSLSSIRKNDFLEPRKSDMMCLCSGGTPSFPRHEVSEKRRDDIITWVMMCLSRPSPSPLLSGMTCPLSDISRTLDGHDVTMQKKHLGHIPVMRCPRGQRPLLSRGASQAVFRAS